MNDDTLTLTLGGEVPLDAFADAMAALQRLVSQLAKEVSGNSESTWIVSDLSSGSAVVSVHGYSPHPDVVPKTAYAFAVVGRSLEEGRPVPYSPEAAKAAENLTNLLGGQITSIQFEARGEVATVTSSVAKQKPIGIVGAYGSIEGRIETLTHRRWLGFTLYDLLRDQPIRCYLKPDQADWGREAWDQRVIVYGWIRRDPVSGYPMSINPVLSIDSVPEFKPGAFMRARGVAPAQPGEPAPEEVIRRMRDA